MHLKDNGGFTLIELIVVMAISVIFTVITAGLFRSSQVNLDLIREQLKVASIIQKAKTLAVSIVIPFGSLPSDNCQPGLTCQLICGYGVYFNWTNKEYILYADKVATPIDPSTGARENCVTSSAPGKYHYVTGEDFIYKTEKIDSVFVNFVKPTDPSPNSTVGDIFFRPPKPHVHFDASQTEASPSAGRDIILKTDTKSAKIHINGLGLVSME